MFRPADPFATDRAACGATVRRFEDEEILLLLRWSDVRSAARDPVHFDSGQRGRVPTPTEEAIRPFRQLPIESNPPEHGKWKDIVQPFFRRPNDPAVKPLFEAEVNRHLDPVLSGAKVEVVHDLALPLQSAALAVLLDVGPAVADEWVGWGLHALRTDGRTDPLKSARFLDFIDRMLARGEDSTEHGFFSALHAARFEGRALTHDEMRGLCHLALAGGRDTLINAITGTFAHLATTPADLDFLRADPSRIPLAVEELFRVLSPLAMIGRVCPEGHGIGPYRVAPGDRAALCWAAANRDPNVFEHPEEIRLNRAPNPHVAFGAGAHTCLGAPMARLILRTLLHALVDQTAKIELLESKPRSNVFATPYLFDSLTIRLHRKEST